MQRSNLVLMACLLAGAIPASARADALERLRPERLAAVRRDVMALQGQRRDLPREGPWREYRANLHVHSRLSHDSRGTIEEIVAAARAVGTHVLLFTEHPADHYDVYTDGHRGLRDGVLLIPGAETRGFLAFPTRSLRGLGSETPQEFSDLIRGRGGLVFLSHLEERMSWDIKGITGVEIYNTHADFKDEKGMQAALRNPLWLWKAGALLRTYPQEAFAALQDYPADYLRRWDELCARAPHTGIAANDAHQNVGLVIRRGPEGKARIEDALGKKLVELDAAVIPGLPPPGTESREGDVVWELRLDPYAVSLRYVGTHLLLRDLTPEAVWEALEQGRAFVAFDWLADATGFDFVAVTASGRHPLGSRLPFADGLRLQAQAPLPGHWRLLRDGKVLAEGQGATLDVAAPGPGNYRVEVSLPVAGEERTWILSNPIYIKGPEGR